MNWDDADDLFYEVSIPIKSLLDDGYTAEGVLKEITLHAEVNGIKRAEGGGRNAGAFNGGDPQARCTPQSEKDVSVNGYWGRELDLSNCAIPTRVRVFTKATGDRRELYVAVANACDDDERVTRFIKTFTIRAKNSGKH